MSEQINNNIGSMEEVIVVEKKAPLQPQPNQAKLIKRTASVLKVINEYFIDKFRPSEETLSRWNTDENQYKLRLLINEKKFKCQKEEDDEETKLRKQLRKEKKKEEKVVKKAEKQINKLKGRPKSACYYFIQDERPKVLLEHPEWNNKEHKREIYLELQNRWKEARLTDKLAHYTKVAEETYKNMPVPVKKPFVPYDRDARKKNSLIGTVATDGKLITKYNKNKYKPQVNDSNFNRSIAYPVPVRRIDSPVVENTYRNIQPRFVDYRKKTPSPVNMVVV